MTKLEKIKWYSEQKTKTEKAHRRNKIIGTLSSCIGIACIATYLYQHHECDGDNTPSTMAHLATIAIFGASLSLRIAYQQAQAIKRYKKQIRKIKKQR